MKSDVSIAVLGGGYAGVLAAVRLARQGLAATLVSADAVFCERIRLHQLGAGQALPLRPIPELLGEGGCGFVQGRVDAIDLSARRLLLEGGSSIGFDRLVLAHGSRSDRQAVPGAREHALGMAELDDARTLHAEVEALAAAHARVLVVGGGLTGIETAAELAEAHPALRVTLASATHPGDAFCARARRHLLHTLAELGVGLESGAQVTGMEAAAARLADGRRLGFDRCVWAGSFRATPLARDAGLGVDGKGRVLLDAHLRSRSHPFVSVAGDAGVVFTRAGRPSAMSCQLAMPMGAYLADRLAAEARGHEAPPFRFRALLRCVSLGRRDGLVQALRGDESPAPLALTGARAARVKEAICRATVRAFGRERRGRGYAWMKARLASAPESAGAAAGAAQATVAP